MNKIIERLVKDGGRPDRILPRDPVILSAPDLLLVVEGAIDLFATELKDGKPQLRKHLCRVQAGGVAFGFDLPDSLVLLAVATPGTSVLRVTLEDLLKCRDDCGAETVSGIFDRWITSIGGGVVNASSPKQAVTLKTGESASVSAAAAARPDRGLVWVETQKGDVAYLGRQDCVFNEDFNVPLALSPSMWVTAANDVLLTCTDTLGLLSEDGFSRALTNFHKITAKLIMTDWVSAQKHEAERLKRRSARDSARMESSLANLASILDTDGVAIIPESSDLLFAACQALSESAGINFKPVPESVKGTHSSPVAEIAASSRVRFREVILKGDWWNRDNGPLLCYLSESETPAALVPEKPGKYRLIDPSKKTSVLVTEEIAEKIKARAFMFYRSFGSKVISLLDLLKIGLIDCRKDIPVLAATGVAAGVLGLIVPVFTKRIFDTVIPAAERGQLFQMSMALVVAAVAVAIFKFVQAVAMLRIEGRLDAAAQAGIWDRLLALPVPFFRGYSSGDLCQRALGIGEIRAILSGTAVQSLLGALFSVFSLLLMFHYSRKLAARTLALVLVGISFVALCSYAKVRMQRVLAAIEGRISGVVLQLLNGIAKLRVSGAEARAFSLWTGEFKRQKEARYKVETISNAVTVFNSVFPILCSMFIFMTLIKINLDLAEKGKDSNMISTGAFLAFSAAFGSFLAAMLAMTDQLMSVLNILPIYERALPIMETVPEVDVLKADPGQLTGNLEVSHVDFRYAPDSPLRLTDVSVNVEPGEMIALVGPSGSGKSTLFRLLLGFETPCAGNIYYDGQDISGLDVTCLRRQLGVVLQNSKVLAGDIFGNIIGASSLTMDDAWEAARMAGLDEDIKCMPMGMQTLLSEGGGTLSGGQRQRLMIARAVAHKPRILYFDEATSALDNHTQAIVSKSLESLKVTRIVIAHRLSTIRNADRIYVMVNGHIVQSGTYDELLAQPGAFAELAKRQIA